MDKIIPKLVQSPEQCCGCSACMNACPKDAITMKEDQYGFLFPVIDEDICISCNKCVKTCDFNNEHGVAFRKPIYGLAAAHKDKLTINKCASGGIATALSEYIVKQGGVVYGCTLTDTFETIHICADSLTDIDKLSGTKYSQSNIGLVYRDIAVNLKSGKQVLFIGTPCQVAGLNSYLGNNINKDKLYTVDLICHGTPNNRLFKHYIDYLNKKYKGKINRFVFRSKNYGWGKSVQEFDITLPNGKVETKFFAIGDSYFMKLFGDGSALRKSCFNCKYTKPERVSDMTIGDFWGYYYVKIPFKLRKGLSCCLVNSTKMMDLLSKSDVNIQEVEISSIINGNPNLSAPSKISRHWEEVMEKIERGKFDEMASNFDKNNKVCRYMDHVKLHIPQRLIDTVKLILRKRK